MREPRQLDPSLLLRVGGISALVAGALFFLTVAYAFGVMAGFGFAQEMFDDRALLLPWVADHAGLYRGLWLLYFASQVFLLPVPLALYTLIGHAERHDDARGSGIAAPCAVAGGAAVVMAMRGAPQDPRPAQPAGRLPGIVPGGGLRCDRGSAAAKRRSRRREPNRCRIHGDLEAALPSRHCYRARHDSWWAAPLLALRARDGDRTGPPNFGERPFYNEE